ncbi:regulator of G protein signaling superfamily [Basidiobolus meristosporus CBS 931.73]|uniref:Regulator of G protein signaling superfamily n=1 Tax=Basidiobolus meristosporus CBS 931.73 TaxID=1314790 RepID=A0A1Y1XVZ6_9FUNG|nr:regulator of G protein signaling superfamily [Basidiobolus meristosporus CBS 931.73]|eukprot:ORX89474.1 regulator of G protein signaling superfamily [Basidiobolus meristosporus CBS 931.73]
MNFDVVQIVYLIIACVWTLFVLTTACVFIKNRNYPSIRYRSVPLFCVNAASNLIVTLNVLLSGPLSSHYSCVAYLWKLYLFLPLWIITTLVKHIRLIILYRFGAEKILFAYSPECMVLGEESKHKKNSYLNTTTEALNRSLFPKGSWLRCLLTSKAHVICILLWMVPHVILTVAIHYQLLNAEESAQYTIVIAECINGWYWSPVLGIFILYTLGLLPVMLYYLRGVRDAYDIKVEVLWDICIGAVSTIACLLSTELNHNETLLRLFPNQMWNALMCMSMYCIAVAIPFCEKRRFLASYPTRDGAQPLFEDILKDSSLFQEFHAFSVRDFSVENPLFYRRVNQWIHDMKDLESSECTPLMRTKLHKEAYEIFQTFIARNADFEINIRGETYQRISHDLTQEKVESTLFDRALSEVTDMMFQQTFPRFLHHKGWSNNYSNQLESV